MKVRKTTNIKEVDVREGEMYYDEKCAIFRRKTDNDNRPRVKYCFSSITITKDRQ